MKKNRKNIKTPYLAGNSAGKKNSVKCPLFVIHLRIVVLAFAVLGCWGTSKVDFENLKVVVLDYGVCKTSGTEPVSFDNMPEEKGRLSTDIEFMDKTDTVKCALNNEFGVRYLIKANKTRAIPVEIKWQYPQNYVDSLGRTVSSYHYSIGKVTNHPTFSAYFLEHNYELIPGTWIFTMMCQGKELYRKEFYLE